MCVKSVFSKYLPALALFCIMTYWKIPVKNSIFVALAFNYNQTWIFSSTPTPHYPLATTNLFSVSVHVPFGHLYVFFEKMSIQIFCSFLNQCGFFAVECYEFFILDISPLPDIWFAIIFPIQ